MRRRHPGLLCVAISLISPPALADATVVMASAGRDCFEATFQPSTPAGDLQALAACDKAVAEVTNDYNRAAALTNRADIRLRLHDYQGAVDDSQQAIAVDPDIAVAYLNRGAGLVGLKKYADAIPILDKAIAMHGSKQPFAYFNRGIAREALGDNLGAYHDYKMAVEADKTFAPAAEQLARFTVTTR